MTCNCTHDCRCYGTVLIEFMWYTVPSWRKRAATINDLIERNSRAIFYLMGKNKEDEIACLRAHRKYLHQIAEGLND